jgi:two-component system, cell cycle sensor histidine kinase and response regulator CckA
MMLEAIGFEPLLASNGPQAIELYRERFHELRVVMLDLTMPGMNGDEVFRELRKIDTSVPVVLTSGFNEQDTVQNFVGRGLAGFLQKPVRLEEMRKKLRAALESRSGSED